MKIYISGKMTGLKPQEINATFDRAEEKVKKIFGPTTEVVNPAKLQPLSAAKTWADFIKNDIIELMKCDAIYMLRNWQESKGAKVEFNLCRTLGILVIFEEVPGC